MKSTHVITALTALFPPSLYARFTSRQVPTPPTCYNYNTTLPFPACSAALSLLRADAAVPSAPTTWIPGPLAGVETKWDDGIADCIIRLGVYEPKNGRVALKDLVGQFSLTDAATQLERQAGEGVCEGRGFRSWLNTPAAETVQTGWYIEALTPGTAFRVDPRWVGRGKRDLEACRNAFADELGEDGGR